MAAKKTPEEQLAKLAEKKLHIEDRQRRLQAQIRSKERKRRTRAAIVAGTHLMNYSNKKLREGGNRHQMLMLIFSDLIGTRDHALLAEYFPMLIDAPEPTPGPTDDEVDRTIPA